MADTDMTLEMTGICDLPFTPSLSPTPHIWISLFDYLSTCPTLHLKSAACSLCLWNRCCECGVSMMAHTIPTPMLAPIYANLKAHMYVNLKAHMYRRTKAQ